MLKPVQNTLTKTEELQLGKEVQEAQKAKEQLKAKKSFTKEQIDKLNDIINVGQAAQDKLFSIEIGLANKLASQLYKQAKVRYDLSDMAQDAYAAVVEAAQSYDPSKNCRFSTYAYYNIYKKVSTSLNKMRAVRLPENKMGIYANIIKAEKAYIDEYNNYDENAMRDYVLNNVKVTPEEYALIKSSLQPVTSTAAPLSDDTTFGDLIEDKNENTDKDIHDDMLADLLDTLEPDEKEMVLLAYSVGRAQMTYDEYLQSHNMTPNEMNRKVQSILRRLRKELEESDRAYYNEMGEM